VNGNMGLSMLASFLLPILLFVGFMLMQRPFMQRQQNSRDNLEALTEETNSLLREILTELKSKV
jgi:preprotein translocase subunit YajC